MRDINIVISPWAYATGGACAGSLPEQMLITLYMPKSVIADDNTVEVEHKSRRGVYMKETIFGSTIRVLRWECFILVLYTIMGFDTTKAFDIFMRADPEFSDRFDEFGFGL